jgi:hypothetical protein
VCYDTAAQPAAAFVVLLTMKFQKGLLNDLVKTSPSHERLSDPPQRPKGDIAEPPAVNVRPTAPVAPENTTLFETVEGSARSWRAYVKLLGIVAGVVLIAAVIAGYMTIPGYGDAVRAPKGMELALRDHFLTVEKRTATDVTVYYCESFYWARVGVEKRPDIKTNPVYQLDRYSARAVQSADGQWTFTAAPITSPEMDVPCG